MDEELKKQLDEINASLTTMNAMLVEIYNYMRTVI